MSQLTQTRGVAVDLEKCPFLGEVGLLRDPWRCNPLLLIYKQFHSLKAHNYSIINVMVNNI